MDIVSACACRPSTAVFTGKQARDNPPVCSGSRYGDPSRTTPIRAVWAEHRRPRGSQPAMIIAPCAPWTERSGLRCRFSSLIFINLTGYTVIRVDGVLFMPEPRTHRADCLWFSYSRALVMQPNDGQIIQSESPSNLSIEDRRSWPKHVGSSSL